MIGPPSCEAYSRPFASKHMLTSEKRRPGESEPGKVVRGGTTTSTRKPGGTTKPLFGWPSASTRPHGPAPYFAITFAVPHLLSSKPGCCQPSAGSFVARHEPSLTTSTLAPPSSVADSLTNSPAGPLSLCARTAMTFRPAARFFATLKRYISSHLSPVPISLPLSQTVKALSAVISSVAFVSAAFSSNALRNARSPDGALPASASSVQIQASSSRGGWAVDSEPACKKMSWASARAPTARKHRSTG